ncbi:MAG: metallophosphoesterase [Pseudomonadota bacterium]
MKLHVLSDLHTEFADFMPPDIDADIVVLAGDIGVGRKGLDWAARHFTDRPVVYVPGNHEYYGHDLTLIDELQSAAPRNIHVLNDDTLILDGVRFLVCTLWTDFKLHGEDQAESARQRARRLLTDFEAIRNGRNRLTPEDSVVLHETSRAWLQRELGKSFEGPTVVVTHHLPAARSVAEQYANDPLNPAFVSSLEYLIEEHRPNLWIHGHTHVPCDYTLFDTRVVCNPRGYPGEASGADFRDDLCIKIS